MGATSLGLILDQPVAPGGGISTATGGAARLTVAGDIRFEKSVAVRGAVRLTNAGADQKVIAAGSLLTEDLTL